MREIYFTDDFLDFFDELKEITKKKIDYLIGIVREKNIITAKIAKKLVSSDFYELRIQVDNEYRVLFFTVDHKDINQSKEIVFLNGFLKKSTKDYDKQIKKAIKILEKWKG